MPAKAGTQGGPVLRLLPLAPASAGATEEEELGIICLVHTTGLPVCFRLLGAFSTETLPNRPRALLNDR